MTLRHLPLSVYNCECDILIRCSSIEPNCQRIIGAVLFKVELWSICLVSQVWIEDVELVALDHFRRWILRVVVHLVVLVPLVALFDTVKEAWLATDEQLLVSLSLKFILREISCFLRSGLDH